MSGPSRFSFWNRPGSGPPEIAGFYEDLSPLLRQRVDVILLLGVFLVPLFSFLDFLLYPEQGQLFLMYRLIASCGCLLLWLINRLKNLGDRSFYLGLAAFYLVGGVILLMILVLDSFSTPYYAGLNLVFIGFGLLVPARTRRLFLHILILYGVYLILVLFRHWPAYNFTFLANNMFVLATLIIALVGAKTNMRLRRREYRLRIDLERVQELLRAHSASLEVLVDSKQKDLLQKVRQLEEQQEIQQRTQRATIFGLAKLADSRDKYTGEHLDRMRAYCREIARELGRDPRYRQRVDPLFVDNLAESCTLHDLGKVAIPDAVLLKPGPLTPEEYETIKRHTSIGGEALRDMDEKLGQASFIQMGREIALYHHERFDGRGYPQGIRGEAIPLSALIVAVADTYDALTAERCYQPGRSHAEAVDIITRERGAQFHPDVVDAFLRIQDRLASLRTEYDDRSEKK
ncbi:MAG: HD domain-containing protein [Desulfobacterota bacterium]|jgi:response regulator RpfG family c-di-GMP phosphodiesterase|nr:HD domain-containing protein [Thermodesulfobacteriota bacterium]